MFLHSAQMSSPPSRARVLPRKIARLNFAISHRTAIGMPGAHCRHMGRRFLDLPSDAVSVDEGALVLSVLSGCKKQSTK